MDLLTAIDTRASSPKLDAPAPTPADLERILSAGVRAPDHGRITPWRFVVLQGDAREILGNALAELRRRKDPESAPEALERERVKARRAPAIVVVAADIDKNHKVPEIEQILAAGAATQNMILAAHALGYGTMWKTGDAAYDPEVKRTLGLNPEAHVVAFLYLGTPGIRGTPRNLSLEGLVSHL